MSPYRDLWNKIKTSYEGDWIKVKVKRPEQIQVIINRLQKMKSYEQTARGSLGLPKYGKLQIRREPEKLSVSFSLKDSGAAL